MLKKFRQQALKIHRNERGAMSVEMMLILVIVAISVLVILYVFGRKIIGWFYDQNSQLDTQHG